MHIQPSPLARAAPPNDPRAASTGLPFHARVAATLATALALLALAPDAGQAQAPVCAYGATPCDPARYLPLGQTDTITFDAAPGQSWSTSNPRCESLSPSVTCTVLPGMTSTRLAVSVQASAHVTTLVSVQVEEFDGSSYRHEPISMPLIVANGAGALPAGCTSPHGMVVVPCDTALTIPLGAQRTVQYATNRFAGASCPTTSVVYCAMIAIAGENRLYTVRYTATAPGSYDAPFRALLALGGDSARSTPQITVPLVALAPLGTGPTLTRDRCIAIPVGHEAAAECGALRLAHALPAVTTRGATRAPMLTYSSAHAHPVITVGADVTKPPAAGANDSVTLALYVGTSTIAAAQRTLPLSAWGGAGERRVSLVADALFAPGGAYQTGFYPVRVTASFTGGTTAEARGHVVVVNRSGSPYGAGWWVAGVEQLWRLRPGATLEGAADSVLWVGGDGSARVYARSAPGSTVFRAETVDRPDSLSYDGPNSRWVRWLPGGARTHFDEAGLQLQAIDPVGQATVFHHDPTNRSRLQTITVPPAGANVTYTFAYGANYWLDSVTLHAPANGAGAAITRTVHTRVDTANVWLARIADPDGDSVTFAPSSAWGVAASRTGRGGLTTTFTYGPGLLLTLSHASVPVTGGTQSIDHTLCAAEAHGISGSCRDGPVQLDSVYTRYDGPRTDVSDVTRIFPDRFGGALKVVNAAGDFSMVTPDLAFPGLPYSARDFSGRITEFFYNARGLPDSVRALDVVGSASAVTRYTWSAACPDRPATVTGPSGVTTSATYQTGTCLPLTQDVGPDTTRRIRYAYHPSHPGLVETVRDARLPQATVYTYDQLSNVSSVTSPAGATTAHVRDALGRDTLVTTPAASNGSAVVRQRAQYDVMGRPRLSETRAPRDTIAVESWFDREGRVVALARRGASTLTSQGELRDSTVYDVAGRPIRFLDNYRPGAGTATTTRGTAEYDAAGNLVRTTNARGQPVTTTYDALSRPLTRVAITNADTSTTSFAYGAAAAWYRAANAVGRDSLVFDPAGRLLAHAITRGPNGSVAARVRWTYDLADRPRTRSVVLGSDSTVVRYAFDPRYGWLDTLVTAAGQALTRHHDADGDLTAMTLGNGVQLTYSPGWGGVPAAFVYKLGTDTLRLGGRYGYEPRLGRYEGVIRPGVHPDTLPWRRFAFDSLGRLREAADSVVGDCDAYYGADHHADPAPGEQPTGYDCDNPSPDPYGRVYGYAYDALGNRLGQVDRGNRLTSLAVLGGTRAFEYDSDGNITRSHGTQGGAPYDHRRAWDALGQLTQVVVTNGDTVRYAYDALGRKARRIGPANDTTYTLWAGNDIAATLNNAGQATALYTHAPGIDQPVSVRAGGAGAATYTYALDAMGNVVGLLDGSGQVAKVYRYGPFGEAELDSLGLVNALRFKARELDPHTGLYDMRARWYDPATGRFVSEDPIGLAGGINEYAFAGNDPVNYSDPSGLSCTKTTTPVYLVRYRGGTEVTRIHLGDIVSYSGDCSGEDDPVGPPGGGGRGTAAKNIGETGAARMRALPSCVRDHYGDSNVGIRAASWGGATPLYKPWIGVPVIGNSSPFTNPISYIGLKYFPGTKMGFRAFGTKRVFGAVGRANAYLAAGLLAYDAVKIWGCALEHD